MLEFKSLISKFTIYQYIISFLMILILAGIFLGGFGIDSLVGIFIAVATTVILDLVIEYFKTKTWDFPQSALISGFFIGGLLTQNLQWYIYVIAGAVAIASKHLIKLSGKNIFNPANFGILLVSIIFGAVHSWWISSPIILVLIFGIFIIWRLRRIDLALSFLISYYLINSIVELSRGNGFDDIYATILNGGIIYFFSMYMLIEPKTNPLQRKQRIIYGLLVAVLFVIFSQYPFFYKNALSTFFERHSIPLALAIGNIFVPILNNMKLEFRKRIMQQNTAT